MKFNSILSLSLTWFNTTISLQGPNKPSATYLNYELIPLIPEDNRHSEPGIKEWWEDFLGLFGADTATKKIKFIEQKFDKIERTKREKQSMDEDYTKIDFGPPNDHWDKFPLFVKDMADNYYNQALTHSLDYFKIIINGVNDGEKGIELHNLGVNTYNGFASLDPIKEIRDMNHVNRMNRITNDTDPKFVYFIHSNKYYFKIVNLARHHFNSLNSLAVLFLNCDTMIYGTLKSWDLVINKYLNHNQTYPKTETIDEKLSNTVIDFHKLGLKELERKYETCIREGLDLTTARLRLHRDGQKKFQEPHVIRLSTWLRCLTGGFSYQLWGCFILSVISYKPLGFLDGNTSDPTNLGLAGVILFLILFHSGCNIYHLWELRQSFCKFESSIPSKVPVLRQSFVQTVTRAKLVVGDIIELRSGSVVPADVRVVTCHSLKLDISKLSGQDQTIICTTYATDENYLESSNVILAGSFVVQGYGQELVIAAGEDSVMGKIYNHVRHPHDHVISKELTSFMNFISTLALGFGFFLILIWLLWLRKSYPGYITISSAVTNATTVIIAFIPEGISFGLTITLAVVSRRLRKHNVLARDLSSIGAAGNITRLLFDKTGTLTLREMQVKLIAFDQEFNLPESSSPPPNLPFEMLLTILNLCNSIAHPTSDPDATDIAILHFTDKFLPRYESSRIYHQLTPTPFRSEQTFMMALYQSIFKTNPFGASPILMVKGAPETLLPYCKLKVGNDGKPIPIDIDLINHQVKNYCNQAMRVLVVAYTTKVESNYIKLAHTTELIYVGMVGIMDTPRKEAKEMISKCKGAGIKFMMMTGDHPATAAAIGRQIGLDINSLQVMTGEQLTTLTSSQWDQIATSDDMIFTRMSSYHKLSLIQKLQSYGHQVGMVGDGVNDTPSLQASDVGFSMGSSCEIAIASSQLVLMDNNLLSIPYIISQGRQVIENISVLLYIIPAGSLSETLPILMNTFLGIPQPLNSLLMTSISLITDLLPSVAVMANVSQSDLMSIPPRDLNSNPLVRKWPLLKSFLFIGISDYLMAHLSYFLYMYWVGGIAPTQLLFAFAKWPANFVSSTVPNPLELQYTSQAMFFATLISLQIIKNGLMTHLSLSSLSTRLFHLRHNPNLWYLFSVLVAIVVTMIFLYVPFVNGIFKTRPLPLSGWIGAIVIALLGVMLFETRLLFSRLPLHEKLINLISRNRTKNDTSSFSTNHLQPITNP